MPKVLINWFREEIDSPERNWGFLSNQGNILKFLYNRYQWYNYPRLPRRGDFPLHVDIEVSAKCDLACPMCPRRQVDTTEYDHMKFELFKKIVDECAENRCFSARLSWRGESLTHPNFLDFVHYIKCEKSIPNVSFLTNGHKMTEKMARGLVEMGLDYISFSIDGIDDVYNTIRSPAKFESVYNNMTLLKMIRDKAGKKRPQIRVNGLWPCIAKNSKAYFEKIGQVADQIVSNPIKDYRVTEETEFVSGYICQYLWQRLFVGFDGRTQPCSNSIERLYVGDVKLQTLVEIWKSEEMENLLKDHLNGQLDKYFACARCSFRVKTDFKGQFERNWSDWDPKTV